MERWCPSQLSKDGWKLRFKSESPKDLMDKFWKYEVWIRAQSAVVCALEVGYAPGTPLVNECHELIEVER